MKKVLLHICCGICAFGAITRLKEEGFLTQGYFFNPNIYPNDEYERRRATALAVGKLTEITIIEGNSDPALWKSACQQYPHEPEGGPRCRLCYELRLKETYAQAQRLKFDYFTTTLTISPHKKSAVVFEVGTSIAADNFLAIDFKKKEGFKKTLELAKKNNLYHQNYCGCVYSQMAAAKGRKPFSS